MRCSNLELLPPTNTKVPSLALEYDGTFKVMSFYFIPPISHPSAPFFTINGYDLVSLDVIPLTNLVRIDIIQQFLGLVDNVPDTHLSKMK